MGRVSMWRVGMFTVLSVVLMSVLFWWVVRVQPERTADVETRLTAIAGQLRAPGDENTMTIASSSSAEAQQIKYEIQQELLANKSNAQIVDDMVKKYGSSVYASPPAQGFGLLAWFTPLFFLVVLSFVGVVAWLKQRELRQKVSQTPDPVTKNAALVSEIPVDLREYL